MHPLPAASDKIASPRSGSIPVVLHVLRALAPGRAVALDELVRRSGVAPGEVRRGIERLVEAGLPVAVSEPDVFSVARPIDLLDAGRIVDLLHGAAVGGVEVFGELDSTSAELARRGPGVADLSFVLTEVQSAGRGRRGSGWWTPPGHGVALSCAKRFTRGLAAQAGLSLAVGVCVLRALEALGIGNVGLKWPNDVIGTGRGPARGKLAGILVELRGGTGGPCTAVLGIGLNVRVPDAQRDRVDQPMTGLAALGGREPPERNLIVARIIAALADGLARFERDGFAAFRDEYAGFDVLTGKDLRIAGPRGGFTGMGAGVDACGALQVRLADGSVRTVDSAGVSVRPA